MEIVVQKVNSIRPSNDGKRQKNILFGGKTPFE